MRAEKPQCRFPTLTPHRPFTSFLMMKMTSQTLMLTQTLTHTPEHEHQAAGQSRKPLPKPEQDVGITIF